MRRRGNRSWREIAWRESPAPEDDDAPWTTRIASSDNELLETEDLIEGTRYDVRVREVSELGGAGPWRLTRGILATADDGAPPAPENVRMADDNCVAWDYPTPPADLAGFRVRSFNGQGATWGEGEALHDGLWAASPFPLCGAAGGIRTVMVRAVDSSGNESPDAVPLVADLGVLDARDPNLLREATLVAGIPPPTIIGGFVSGPEIHADLDALTADGCPLWREGSVTFWAEDDELPMWGRGDEDLWWVGDLADGRAWWRQADSAEFWGTTFQDLLVLARLTPAGAALGETMTLSLEPEIDGEGWRIEWRTEADAFWDKPVDEELEWGPDDLADYWTTTPPAWRPWPGRIEGAPPAPLDLRVFVPGGRHQGRLVGLAVRSSAPDEEEVIHALQIPAGGRRLPLTKAFREVRSVTGSVFAPLGASLTALTFVTRDRDPILGPFVELRLGTQTGTGVADFVVKGVRR